MCHLNSSCAGGWHMSECACVSGIDIDFSSVEEDIHEINSPMNCVLLTQSELIISWVGGPPLWAKPHPWKQQQSLAIFKEPAEASLLTHIQLIVNPSLLFCIWNVLSYHKSTPLSKKMHPWQLDRGSVRESFILSWMDFKHTGSVNVFYNWDAMTYTVWNQEGNKLCFQATFLFSPLYTDLWVTVS